MTDEHKKKIGLANKGKIVSLETRLKIGLANSIALKGKKQSKISKKKRREFMLAHPNKGQFKKGQTSWNKNTHIQTNTGRTHIKKGQRLSLKTEFQKGVKHTQEWKDLMSKLRSGDKHYKWKVDRTQLKKFNDTSKDRRSYAYNNWRREVWTQDDWKCRINNSDCKGRLEAHHILSYTYYPELRYDINNGITLCQAHHPRKRAEEKRLSPYFKELVSVSKI